MTESGRLRWISHVTHMDKPRNTHNTSHGNFTIWDAEAEEEFVKV
jgi:hypothetical protein